MVRIKNTKILKCDITCKFHWSKLPRMMKLMCKKILDLCNADLYSADLRNANLCNADLQNANLHYADLRNSELCNANLSNADLSYADLCNSDLSSANLSNANLCNADLHYANLRHANLNGADLCSADLSNADLRNAGLRGAKLKPINGKEVIIQDFMSVTGLGSINRKTLIFNTNLGIVVQCGCFYGTDNDFKKKVNETHKNTNYEREYLEMLKLAKIRFERSEDE